VLPTRQASLPNETTTGDNPILGDSSSSSIEHYIEACSYVFVFISFTGTLAFPATFLLEALTDSKVWNNTIYIAGPVAYGAMVLSSFLQPLNNTFLYKVLLFFQAFLVLVFPDIIRVLFHDPSPLGIIISLTRVGLGFTAFRFLLSIRARVARLPAKRLSRFLTDHLVVPALTFLGVVIFFALDPIRCWLESPEDLSLCDRTLVSQAGLVTILLTHFVLSNLSAVFPKRITDKHIISLRQFATGDLTIREGVKITVIAFAVCCGFYLFAQYNARANLQDGETAFLIVVGGLGTFLLFVTGLWEWKAMERETREVGKSGEEEAQGRGEANETALRPVTKLHWGFQVAGLVASSAHAVWALIDAVTLDETGISITFALLPFVGLLFGVAFMSDPRSGNNKFEKILFTSFTGSELPAIIWNVRNGNVGGAVFNVFRFVGWLVLLHFGLKFRDKVAALRDVDLSKFLLESMLKNATQNISGMLFVTFRALNCVMETRSFEACSDKIACSMFISVYLVVFVGVKAVVGAMSEDQKRNHAISWDKLVTMKGIRKRHQINSFLTMFTGACGMFLFCLMNSADKASETTIKVVGYLGLTAVALVLVSEIVMLLRATAEEKNGGGLGAEQVTEVTEVADFWVKLSVAFTTTYMLLYLAYAIDPWGHWWEYANLIVPIVTLSYVISIFAKPLREDAAYERVFLTAHLCQMGIVDELLIWIGNMKMRLLVASVGNVFRIGFYVVAFKLAIGLRNAIKKLTRGELSIFLVNLLVRGAACLSTMVFLLFEVLACWLENMNASTVCENTSTAAMCLSIFLIIGSTMSIASLAVPKAVRNKTAMTKEVSLDEK